MYLTRLRLDPRSAQARRDLSDPYDMHRTLVRAFVRDAGQVPPRILWRAEPVAAWSEPTVLVQAQVPADWSVLEGLPNYLKGRAETHQWQPGQWLTVDASLRFRLFANPTVTREGKRQGLLSEEAQLGWLARQGERHGFAVEAALVTGSELLRGRKGEACISLLKVCFEGRLRVRDVAAMAQAVSAGIGPGKAFGCGLLSLGRG
ncbi:type I-E CRISPR-associated protein Cas6/Cse3/CasE [Stutzerimonas kirkiae]|uniref:type I-E CRISPR-associated protein Cas6/Cse3/CasE n=1 Tax=Stutzerimonas kirkiae TaxID=2211392 RepID=UPI0010385B21|nr:type I-E CRISPR-associated protein Cas6/Cse3/CasE [Stutzerimonas kirkiae]TBV04971.1 type I-E CRISPR-associated protein Cas6/Cse3/CasE [Stutzerimonas kirkiae]TBV13728.1 type I-E CRISPR-associated protein Cas6/Cse3/CasE [Stutzerimonas kirkiae]